MSQSSTNPLLADMLTYFTSLGIIQGEGIDGFRDFTPEEPSNIVVLHEYKGSEQPHPADFTHRSVQVLVRHVIASEAYSISHRIYASLIGDESRRVNFTDERFGQVVLRNPPFKIKYDERDWTYYAFNVGITTSFY